MKYKEELVKMSQEELVLEMSNLKNRHLKLANLLFSSNDENEIEFINEQLIEFSLRIVMCKELLEECL